MKKSKFSEKQILDILKEQVFGKTVAEICRSRFGTDTRCRQALTNAADLSALAMCVAYE